MRATSGGTSPKCWPLGRGRSTRYAGWALAVPATAATTSWCGPRGSARTWWRHSGTRGSSSGAWRGSPSSMAAFASPSARGRTCGASRPRSPRRSRSAGQVLQPLQDLALRHGADQPILLRAVLEEQELRDRLDPEARRERRMLVHVDLADRHLVAQLARDLLEHGPDNPAGPAPRRPEVDHHRPLARDHAIERRVRHFHSHRHQPPALETLQCPAWIHAGRLSMNRATSFMCSSKNTNTGIER